MLSRIQRNVYFVRHLDARQVWARCWLMAKRRTMVRLAGLFPGLKQPLVDQPEPTTSDPPRAVFPARTFARALPDQRLELSFLNEVRTFGIPADWHSSELEHGTRLWKLNLHYMEFVESLSDDDFSLVVADWIDANPPYRKGYWLDNWNSYALSIRCVVWMQQLALRGDGVSAAAREKIIRSLWEQLAFLENNLETDIGGNHLIKNIKALLLAGKFFRGKRADRWSALARSYLSTELRKQFLVDGMHFERSPAYHNQVFADLIECYAAWDQEDRVFDHVRDTLSGMAQVTADLVHPDGNIPLFNDAGICMAYSPSDCLDAFEGLMQDRPKVQSHVYLPLAGYFGFRSNGSFFLADCGPIGPDGLLAHAHGDILSFEWSVQGKRMIVDPGVFEYNPGRRRDASRSSREHNTVTLDDKEQCDFYGSFRCGRRAHAIVLHYARTDSGFILEGTHDGFADTNETPRHVRRFEVSTDEVTIHDRMIGGPAPVASAGFLLHPSCVVSVNGRSAKIRIGATVVDVRCDQNLILEPAVWWPDMGMELETTRLRWVSRGQHECKTVLRVTSH